MYEYDATMHLVHVPHVHATAILHYVTVHIGACFSNRFINICSRKRPHSHKCVLENFFFLTIITVALKSYPLEFRAEISRISRGFRANFARISRAQNTRKLLTNSINTLKNATAKQYWFNAVIIN